MKAKFLGDYTELKAWCVPGDYLKTGQTVEIEENSKGFYTVTTPSNRQKFGLPTYLFEVINEGMTFNTKYKFGDKVWRIYHDFGTNTVNCTECDKNGKLLYKNHLIECPFCNGKKVTHVFSYKHWKVYEKEYTITGVQITHHISDEIKYPNYYFINLGYGPDTHDYEEYLFKSEEEARLECERRNKNES